MIATKPVERLSYAEWLEATAFVYEVENEHLAHPWAGHGPSLRDCLSERCRVAHLLKTVMGGDRAMLEYLPGEED